MNKNKVFKTKKYFSQGNGGAGFELILYNNEENETYLNFVLETDSFAQLKSRTDFLMTKQALETLMEMLNEVHSKFPKDSKEKGFICDDWSKNKPSEGENSESFKIL